MEKSDFQTEKEHIFKVTKTNGYGEEFVNKIYKRYHLKHEIKKVTTLSPIKKPQRFISVPYYPDISNGLRQIFKKYDMKLVTYSPNTLKSNIYNYKDKENQSYKSGIYKFQCEDCIYVYTGQTRRRYEIRKREHELAVNKKIIEKSAIAEHMEKENHNFNANNGQLLQVVSNETKLNAGESFFIDTEWAPLMNRNEAPIMSSLFKIALIGF